MRVVYPEFTKYCTDTRVDLLTRAAWHHKSALASIFLRQSIMGYQVMGQSLAPGSFSKHESALDMDVPIPRGN